MKKLRAAIGAVIVIGLSSALSAQAPSHTSQPAPKMTQQQLDEQILNELKAIHALLDRMAAQQPAAPQVAGRPTSGKITGLKGYVLGQPNAPLTMVEFSDLQCPYCRQYITTTFAELRKNWIDTGKVRYITRDFPLTSLHPQALAAARAARCAGEQGKFWDMHTALMTNANLLNAEYITRTASNMKLDMKAFAACTASDKSDSEIEAEFAQGVKLGVSGTPTFLLGRTNGDSVEGPIIVGAMPYAVFDQELKELAAKK